VSIASLHEAADATRFGGKAVALGHALRGSLPVPGGLALSSSCVERLVAGEAAVWSEFRAAWASAELTRVAVRSSAVGEDSSSASYAGQHATRLGVVAEALPSAIAEVHASATSAGAVAYRRRIGATGAARMGIAVQAMVDADRAGVMFTRDPRDGRDVRVIEAAWGLGEVVVDGRVTPDRFVIAPGGELLEQDAGDKDVEVVALADGSTAERAVPPERAQRLCLSAEDLSMLDTLALRCDGHWPGPHDIEWAFAGARLFLLQRRPITR